MQDSIDPTLLFRHSDSSMPHRGDDRDEAIYVASSWRNTYQPVVVSILRASGFAVYDFREPLVDTTGFAWRDIDPEWKSWDTASYIAALESDVAKEGFHRDMTALSNCDICVLVLPCGRSAHLELGYCAGAVKKTCILSMKEEEPELMNKMVDHISGGITDLLEWLGVED